MVRFAVDARIPGSAKNCNFNKNILRSYLKFIASSVRDKLQRSRRGGVFFRLRRLPGRACTLCLTSACATFPRLSFIPASCRPLTRITSQRSTKAYSVEAEISDNNIAQRSNATAYTCVGVTLGWQRLNTTKTLGRYFNTTPSARPTIWQDAIPRYADTSASEPIANILAETHAMAFVGLPRPRRRMMCVDS